MRKISDIYGIVKQCRENIIKTMQERGIKEIVTFMPYAEWCKEYLQEGLEPEENEDDDTAYLDYKDEVCPYCVFCHKYSMEDYRIEKVILEKDRFKFEGYSNELGFDWQWEDDTVWGTRINVWERLAEILGIAEEPEYVWVFTAEQTADSEVMENIAEVFATEEAAQAHLHKFVYGNEGELAYATKRGWVVSDNKPNHFCAYEDGRYVENHTEATVEKKEVKK